MAHFNRLKPIYDQNYDFKNPVAVLKKIEKSPYLSNGLTDRHELLP